MAGEAWLVADRDFSDRIALNFYQSWQEPVHSFEKLEIINALPLERPIATSGIGDMFVGGRVANPIGYA